MDHFKEFQNFLATRHNYIPTMAWEASIAPSIGLSLDQLRFTVAMLASVLVGLGIRPISSPTLRHLYSLATGLLLVYYPFGFGVIHAAIPSLLTYLSMLLAPKHCGTLAWAVNFPYLIYLHVVNASGESWSQGIMDFSGCSMVMLLKLVSLAMCYQDHVAKRKEDMTPFQAEHAVSRVPNPLEYASYIFSMGNLLAGPYLEYKQYKEFIEHKGLWDPKATRKIPSPLLPGLLCLGQSLLFAGLYVVLSPTLNRTIFYSGWYSAQGFVVRMFTMLVVTFTMQLKLAFSWKLSETSLTFAGINFAGFSESGAPRWGRCENVRFGVLLLCDSARICPAHWNTCTGNWLRRYVYERATPRNRKPGFAQLLFTQMVSAVWHGLYPGYLLFFLSTALWIHFSTVIFKAEMVLLPPAVASSIPLRAIKILWTHLCLNYLAVAFLILDFRESIKAWSTVYFAPHAIMLVGCFLVPMLLAGAGGKGKRKRAAAVASPSGVGATLAAKEE